MKIFDAVIMLCLLLGALIGFKKGFIKTLVTTLGMFLVIILTIYLKTPVVNFLYSYFPFFELGGLKVLNLFLYEAVAVIFIFILLSSILGIIINVSGIVEKVLNATIVLGVFSKILGAIAGLLEMLLFLFVGLFVLARFDATSELVMESKAAQVILAKTPVIGNIAGPTYASLSEIRDLKVEYNKNKDKEDFNVKALSVFTKYNLISESLALKLVQDGKIKIDNPEGFIIKTF